MKIYPEVKSFSLVLLSWRNCVVRSVISNFASLVTKRIEPLFGKLGVDSSLSYSLYTTNKAKDSLYYSKFIVTSWLQDGKHLARGSEHNGFTE